MMRSTVFLCLCALLSVECVSQSAEGVPASNLKKLDWLEGTWVRTNAKPGKSAYERWERSSETEWTGFGVSLQGGDTTFMEKLRIVTKDTGIFYVADVPENQQPVYFLFTSLDATGFVCENLTHDFPKKISYSLEGSRLVAQISGDGNAVDFIFERKD